MSSGATHFFDALAWTLIHSLWQGTLVSLCYYVCRRCTTSAAVRYIVGHGCLAAFIIGQAVTLSIVLSSPLALVEWVAGEIQPARVGISGQNLFRQLPTVPFANVIAKVEPLLVWVGVLWLSCSAARLAWFSALFVGLQFELRRCAAIVEPAASKLQALAKRAGVKARFVECAAISVPGTVGWLRPIVLVPVGFLTATAPQDVEAIILHELAHIARRDFVGNLLRLLVRSLYYFHLPLLWLTRQLDEDAEQATDYLAAATHGDLEQYGAAFHRLEIARPTLAFALGATGGTLATRMRHLVETKSGVRHSAGRMIAAMAVGMLSLLSVGYATTSTATNRAELEWLSQRDLTRSVVETLSVAKPNHTAEHLIRTLHPQASPAPASLIALARAFKNGFDPTLFEREAAEVPYDVKFSKARLPTFGTYAERERLVKALRDLMPSVNADDRVDLARAAVMLASLDLIDRIGIPTGIMILDKQFLPEMRLDDVSRRRLEYAVAMHNRRNGQFVKIILPLQREGKLTEAQVKAIRDLLPFAPGVTRNVLRSQNPILREQVLRAIEESNRNRIIPPGAGKPD